MNRVELAEWIKMTCKGPLLPDYSRSPRPSLNWDLMVKNPEMMEEIARLMSSDVYVPRGTEMLAGIVRNGMPVVEALGRCYRLPWITIDIKSGKISGRLYERQRVCLVDDTTSSGLALAKGRSILIRYCPEIRIVSETVVVLERMDPRGVNALFRRQELV